MGKLIVIEGTDGSGKQTQVKLLKERLSGEEYSVLDLSFPQYGKKSAGLIEEYLNNKYGAPDRVNPYAASLFFAVDRFDASENLRELLKANDLILLDRYVDSNAGHQGGKIADAGEKERFLEWLYDIEYNKLQVPKPDLVIILRVPAEIGQKLVAQKHARAYLDKGTHDGHEMDLRHLKNAEASYLALAERFADNHAIIECVENGKLLAPEIINEKIYQLLKNKQLV